MPSVNVRITNIAQIKSAFGRAPFLMTKNLNAAIYKSILTIQRASMQNTPVDTGRLRASHYTQIGNLKGEVGTNTNYDLFVHEGTRFMKSRPYLRKAVEAENPAVQRFFEEAVDDTLGAIARNV